MHSDMLKTLQEFEAMENAIADSFSASNEG